MGRIAITGIGMADSLGSNTTECWGNYLHKPHLPEDFREPHPSSSKLEMLLCRSRMGQTHRRINSSYTKRNIQRIVQSKQDDFAHS